MAHVPAVKFFRTERNRILKEGPLKIGQVIRAGKILKASELAREFYDVESRDIPATVTVGKHLESLETIVANAETRFGGVGNGTI